MIISDNPTAELFPVFRPVSRLLDDMVDFFFREQGRHVHYFMVWIYCQMIASRNSSSKTLESTKKPARAKRARSIGEVWIMGLSHDFC